MGHWWMVINLADMPLDLVADYRALTSMILAAFQHVSKVLNNPLETIPDGLSQF